MSEPDQPPELKSRVAAATEHSWCKAVPGGTGITVLSLFLRKPPDLSLLQNSLHKLQDSHPILRSKLRYNTITNTFSFTIPPVPLLELQPFDLQHTSRILNDYHSSGQHSLSPFQKLIEHELNQNPWSTMINNSDPSIQVADTDVLYANVYSLEGSRWVVALKLHTGACDRVAAVYLLRELMGLMMIKRGRDGGGRVDGDGGGVHMEVEKGEVNLGIEEYIPSGKANKPFWARGVDMLGYSLNAFRLAQLNFVDDESPRCSQLVRLQLDSEETAKLLEGCKTREIKLCGALAAAVLMSARLSKGVPDGQWEKYAVVTLINCRPNLEPALSSHHVGFYHSAILNTHDMSGGEQLWELARRIHASFEDSKNSDKHFSDMADLNFLMCKAIDNPSLTPSSSLRTSFISVFEDLVVDEPDDKFEELGVEDYMGCASVHGVGPSVALFDTIRGGRLDCACVYPAPLHSREQMQGLIDHAMKILVSAL